MFSTKILKELFANSTLKTVGTLSPSIKFHRASGAVRGLELSAVHRGLEYLTKRHDLFGLSMLMNWLPPLVRVILSGITSSTESYELFL